MNFLAWFLPDWLSKVPATIGGAILKAIKTAVFSLDTFIYKLIIDLYDMFMSLCSVRLLSSSLLQSISQRIGLVLGLVMLFFVIFSFIEMLLNPDTISDKEKGVVSIIKKTILVIVMLGTCNFVFDTLFNVQKIVVQSNIISKLLLPYSVEIDINGDSSSGNGVMDNEKFGSLLSEELLMAFYKFEEFDEGSNMSTDDANIYSSCQATVNAFKYQIINYKRFDLGYNCLNEDISVQFSVDGSNDSNPQETSIINFNWPLSVVCGIAVVYILFMYCLKVGVRMVQLMFLEVISPMAIVSYLSPKKDTVFSKWQKIYISTYIDVFIRIAIINFVFFLIATVFSTTSGGTEGLDFWNSLNPTNGVETSFYVVVIVLALLTFAKKAPELLKELLPASASKLGFGSSMKDIVGLKKGVGIGTSILGGAVGGAAIGLLSGSPGGAIGGMLKGSMSGLKGQGFRKTVAGSWKSEKDAIKKTRDIRANGGSWLGSRVASMQGALGIRNAYDRDLDEYNEAKKYNDIFKAAKSEAQSEVDKHEDKYLSSVVDSDGITRQYSLGQLNKMRNSDKLDPKEQERYERAYQLLRKNATEHALNNNGAISDGSGVLWDTTGSLHDLGALQGGTANVIDSNVNISNNMDYVLKSSANPGTGNRVSDAKATNKHYETVMVKHNTSRDVSRHKANAGK